MMNGLRKPNIMKEKTEDSTPKSVMSSFKITFLNATLKFVKDDSQMVLSYSNMSTEQADFVKQIIDQCMETGITKAGFKGLYDPLSEALRIFSLKYDFKLHVETLGDMKKLRFEKTRKISDTIKREETRIVYEETTDSDSSLKQIGRSKSQKKLTTLIDAISQITPAFKLRTLTELKDFVKDKIIDNHTFTNLNLYEQQFISHWQALTQRVEVMKLLDLQGQMVLDEIRDSLKKKTYRVKVELGMTSAQNRFAKLTKVFPNNVKQTEEEMTARLEAMAIATKARRAACAAGQNSSGDSSSDSNMKPRKKFNIKVARFLQKTNGVQNEWIQTTLTKLRNFLQDEAEASLRILSITDLQAPFLAKWQNLLSKSAVINTYPTDVQVLMHDVRDVAAANKKKFRVVFSLTKLRNGARDAVFRKLPAFSDVPKNTSIPANIVPKVNGNKVEITAQKAAAPKATNMATPVKLEPKSGGIKNENSSENVVAPKTMDPPPDNKKNVEMSVETASPAPKKKKIVSPVSLEPKQSGNKAENSANATKIRVSNVLHSGSLENLYRTVCKTLKAAHDQRNEVLPVPIHKSTSLTSLDQKKNRSKNAKKVVKLPAATVKLIEGLNQPLVSERGSKMMRQMGWEGGPLGLRGEGIAEPIMPELDLCKRAGLGAPKPNIQDLVAASKATNHDMREVVADLVDNDLKNVVMQTLLRMVKGEESMITEIRCRNELTTPDWNYIMNVATTFNNREIISDGMSAVLQLVTDEELMLTAAWSWAKTEILLILSKSNVEVQISREKWGYVALAKETLSKNNRRRLVEVSAARNIDRRVMVTGQAFKYYVMSLILDFCLNCHAESPTTKEVTKDIILKGTMVKKQLSFTRDVINRVNSSAPCSSSYEQDIVRHNEIITAMQGKGYKMSVEFPSLDEIDGKPVHNIISLTKTYGYRTKTVLIKKPPAKTQEKNIQVCTDIIEIDIQQPMKTEPKDSKENKENNIQTANNIDNEAKIPVESKGIIKPKEENKTTDDNINDIINSLTEINIDDNTGSDQRLSKRMRPQALAAAAVPLDRAHKRTKYDYVKHINIEPKDYPHTIITKTKAAEIQKSIQQTIDHTQVLPLLKCHGIQDGVLSYSCHNEESLEIIQNVVKPLDLYVTLTEESEKGVYRMSLKLNTFIDETVESIFNNLETFNLGLSTKAWKFLKKEQYSDFIVIFVDMDLDSYKFIRGEHFKLYVGIDEARFSIVWG